MAEKKQGFVVTDKRKFTLDGELREDTSQQEAAQEPAPKAQPPQPSPPPKPEKAAAPSELPNIPPPPSDAEQQRQQQAYRESGKQFESPLAESGRAASDFEMTFERLVASLYMTAMMQLGLMHEEGGQPMADLVGAKQSIDTLGVLQEKTKSNLTDAEQKLLQNCLYELRMAFVEVTNAITRGAQARPATPGSER